EMGHTAGYYYVGKDPSFAFATALPFGLNSRQQESWQQFGGGMELLDELFKQYNCHAIPTGNTGAQMGGWFRTEIKTLHDLNGIKMRIGGFAGRVVAKLGVVPQQLAPGDIYPSLEKGTIDAAEWVGPYDDEKLGFVKIAKYYYYPGWWEGGAQGHTLINIAKWNELPKNYQAVLTAVIREAGLIQIAKYDAQNPPAMKRVLTGNHGGVVQGGAGDLCGDLPDQPAVQEAEREHVGLPRRRLSVVADRRAPVRFLHDPPAHADVGPTTRGGVK